MARKRNPETIQKIADASWRLFGEKGYAATSYADVSAESGINRATVQHYFPAKELMAAVNLTRLRDSAVAEAESMADSDIEPFALLYLLGQIYIAALLSCNESRNFFKDVLESRTLTEDTITSDFNWSMSYVFGDSSNDVATEEAREDIVVAMGGLYDLMYYCMRNDKPINVSLRLQPAFLAFAKLQGLNESSMLDLFNNYTIPSDDLEALGIKAYKASVTYTVSEVTELLC